MPVRRNNNNNKRKRRRKEGAKANSAAVTMLLSVLSSARVAGLVYSSNPCFRRLPSTLSSRRGMARGPIPLAARKFSDNNKDPNFLTSDDLGPERVYKALDGYEEDIESMAANYMEYANDDENNNDENYRSESTTTVERSSTATSTATQPNTADDSPPPPLRVDVSDTRARVVPTTDRKDNQKENIDDEPLSPLSFLSNIAEPTHLTSSDSTANSAAPPIDYEEEPGNNSLRFLWDDEHDNDVNTGPSNQVVQENTGEPMVEPPKEESIFASKPNLSPEELRSKFYFSDDEINFPSMVESTQRRQPLESSTTPVTSPKASRGKSKAVDAQTSIPPTDSSRLQDQIFQLETSLTQLQKEIVALNDGKAFNLGSYKQVSEVLFGTPGESTSKNVLEGLAGSTSFPKRDMARLILEHRQTKQQLTKLRKKQEQVDQRKNGLAKSDSSPSSHRKHVDPLLLIDTSSFIFRAYYSMPPMHRSDGLPISAVLGFCNMLNRLVLTQLLKGLQPRLVLCCDASGKTFRHERYSEYKSHRPEAPIDLIPQFDLIRQAAKAYGMLWIEAPGYEADDVIASLAHQAVEENLDVKIYSGDKDLMQLITLPQEEEEKESSDSPQKRKGIIGMVDPMTMNEWDHESVVEKWGVAANQLGDVLALAGDAADNIPGVPGIGPKIAAQLLNEFGTLENLYENLEQVRQVKRKEKLQNHKMEAFLSRELVELERGLDWSKMEIDPNGVLDKPTPETLADLRMEAMNADRILDFYDEMGFVTIKQRLLERLQKQTKIAYTSSEMAFTKRSKNFSKPNTSVPKPEDFDNVPF